ncbi:MAG: hypothetical protein LQ340_005115 [Diploschistes diacapsis]|nr:MAG: hypothetical protein LQ340_005115 [Diploschistes diacapsis]
MSPYTTKEIYATFLFDSPATQRSVPEHLLPQMLVNRAQVKWERQQASNKAERRLAQERAQDKAQDKVVASQLKIDVSFDFRSPASSLALPKEIIDAAKAKWGGGGATQTINVKNSGVSVDQTQKLGGSAQSAKTQRRNAIAEAVSFGYYLDNRDLEGDDFELYIRDFKTGLLERDLDDDYFFLYERDIDDDEFNLYERDLDDNSFNLYERDEGYWY